MRNRSGLVRRGRFWVDSSLPKVPPHPSESRERFYNDVIIRSAKAVMAAQGIEITVQGAENVPAAGPALLAINHTGYYDFIFAGIVSYLRGKRLVRFMAKKEIFDVPVVGWLMRRMSHIPVDRSAGGSALIEAEKALADARLVGIFPEATISRSFELKEFKTGAVRIAAASGAPLLPMVIWGSQRLWTKGQKKHLGRNNFPIWMRVGAPVPPDGDPEEATARLRAAMTDLMAQVRRDYDAEYGPFPDGEAWRPAALGGAAPTLEQANAMDARDRAAKAARREARGK